MTADVAGIHERVKERHAENARIYDLYSDYRRPPFSEEVMSDFEVLLSEIARLATTERELASARAALAMLAEWVGGDMHYASPDVEQAVKEALTRVDG